MRIRTWNTRRHTTFAEIGQRRVSVGLLSAVSFALTVVGMGGGTASAQQAETATTSAVPDESLPAVSREAPPPAEPPDDEVEEITIKGIRRSLRFSADFKRKSTGVVDSINSEDLGKFPDTNVAESLQRITGVGITRTRGGEGQFVTVRGLGEEFNAVTYNGRLLATENNGREFSFDVIASELIAGAEVYKTPTARQGDGSLGGRVNLRPAMPLDNPGLRVAASIGGQYEGLADSTGLRASGVASYTMANDTIGVLGSFSYQKRNARTDVAESTFLVNNVQVDADGLSGAQLDQDGDGFNDTTNARILTNDGRFNGLAASLVEQERERIGGTAAVQYRPSKRFTLTVDGLYTTFRTPSTQFSYSYFPTLADPTRVAPNSVLNSANQIVSHSATPFATDLVVRENEGDSETFAVGANADWQVFDDLKVRLDVSMSRSDGQRDNLGSAGGSGGFFVIGYPDGAFRQFGTSRRVPDAFFTAANTPGGPQVPLSQLVPDDARLHFARNDIVKVEDQIISARADADWNLDEIWKFGFGFDVVAREKQNNAFNNIPTQCQFCGYATPFAEFGDPGRLFDGFTPSDFLSGTDANIPRVFPRLNPDAIRAAYANGAPDALTAVADRRASSTVEEIVTGGYVQVDHLGTFLSLPYAVNLGVRFAHTSLTSKGFGNVVSDIVSVVRASDGNNQTFGLNDAVPLNQTNSYFDVLPSLNVAVDITETIIARLGVSRSLSRPTLTDLSTFFSVSSTNVGGEGIVRSNPGLEAIRSTNLDISLEWYGEAGTYIGIAGFYKNVSNFVTQRIATEQVTINDVTIQRENDTDIAGDPVDITFRIQEPQNGDTADIFGLEIGGQYISPIGLGIAANLTLTDSEATSGGVSAPLENISDFSANVSLFYERSQIVGDFDALSVRISLNHRSDYLVGQTFEGGRNEFVDDFTQYDLSVRYNITEELALLFEGINITNEKFFRFSETRDFIESFEDNGARWVFGVRGRL